MRGLFGSKGCRGPWPTYVITQFFIFLSLFSKLSTLKYNAHALFARLIMIVDTGVISTATTIITQQPTQAIDAINNCNINFFVCLFLFLFFNREVYNSFKKREREREIENRIDLCFGIRSTVCFFKPFNSSIFDSIDQRRSTRFWHTSPYIQQCLIYILLEFYFWRLKFGALWNLFNN